MKVKLVDNFEEDLSGTTKFDVRYYEKLSVKCWLVNDDHLEEMYKKFESGDIFLWCDANTAKVTARAGTEPRQMRDEYPGST